MRPRPRQLIFAGNLTDCICDVGSEQFEVAILATPVAEGKHGVLNGREKGPGFPNEWRRTDCIEFPAS